MRFINVHVRFYKKKYVGYFFFCIGVMYSGEYDACDVTLSVYPHQASLKICLTTVVQRSKVVGSFPTVVRHIFKLAWCGYTLRVTSQASYVG
jgi:hypothetical protein